MLSSIPMDGTFNQTAPLDRLRGIDGTVYSFDLKSATDRWPLLLLFELVQCLFDRSFASSVVNSTLGTNVFDIAFVRKHRHIRFVTGPRVLLLVASLCVISPCTGVVRSRTVLPWSSV